MEDAGDWCSKNHMTTDMHVLEINLISAQGLKVPSNNFRRMQTYAVAWVDPSVKLRTRVDGIGEENPTWNDKFLFRVTSEFLSRETSGVSIEIYAVGCFSDTLVGTVRFLVGNVSSFTDCMRTPAFTAVQVRRPSGRCQGVLNIGVMVNDDSNFASLNGISAIGYRDLMGESFRRRRRKKSQSRGSEISIESYESSFPESPEFSDGSESSASSSSTASNVLKDWNGVRNMAGTKTLKASSGSGFLCGLVMQKKTHLRPSENNLQISSGSPDIERLNFISYCCRTQLHCSSCNSIIDSDEF